MHHQDQTQAAFKALADPTRRAIIEMVARDELRLSDIASAFEMTRPAVAKHLHILEEGGFVTTERRGRERVSVLNPQGMENARTWMNQFEQFWDDRLAALKKEVEKD